MPKTTPEQNKAIVLKAFDTLFNKRDYNAAERFWSPTYIQHSAHIAPDREGLFNLVRSAPNTLRYENQLMSQKAITSSRTAVSLETGGTFPWSPLTSSVSKTVYLLSTGTYYRTKPQRESPSAAFPGLATVFLRKP
jgi:hypothetical protein